MKKDEICKILNITISDLEKHFPRVQKKFENRGIIISKSGRGVNAEYDLKITRAPSLFLEEKENEQTYLTHDQINFSDWELLVFIGICAGELPVYWGYYKDFLKYLGVENNKENIELLKEALQELEDRHNLIQVMLDKTCDKTFTAAITRATHTKVEKNLLYMIKKCKELQRKYHKRNWLNLLRVWLLTDYIQDEQPHTYKSLVARSGGLSLNAIKTSIKILEEEGILQTELVYFAGAEAEEEAIICKGKKYHVYEFLPELQPNIEEAETAEIQRKIEEYEKERNMKE